MVAESEEKVVRRCLVKSIDADMVVGVCGMVEGENVSEGLGGVWWGFFGHF